MATDGFLLDLQNTADTTQTFELFSPTNGDTLIPDELGYTWTIEFSGSDYFDPATLLWQPGLYGWAYSGIIDPLIGTLTPSITIAATKTRDELIVLLNELGSQTQKVGEWDIQVVTKPEKKERAIVPGAIYLQVSVKMNTIWVDKYLDIDNFQFGSKYFQIAPASGKPTLYLDKQSTEVADYGGGVLLPEDKKIIIGSGSPNFTYDQFVNSIQQRTYDVKGFEVYCENKDQLLQPFLFDRKLATGRVYQKILTPIIDPYQNQNYVKTPDKTGYKVDGFTSLKYSILPYSCARILLKYNYIDISTPLLVTKKEPKIQQFIGDTYSNQAGGPYNTIPCWGCVGGAIVQHGSLGGPTGFNNANINGWCGSVNGDDFYNSPTHSALQGCTSNPPPPAPGWTYSGSLNTTFINNMTSGYDQFGCKFLASRLGIHEGTLAGLVAAGTNPQWQAMLVDKVAYIKNKMKAEGCTFDAIPQFSQMSELYKPRDLFIPTNDFIQHQIDVEQGAEKLIDKYDFPMDTQHNE
jgi:hypothetical protein